MMKEYAQAARHAARAPAGMESAVSGRRGSWQGWLTRGVAAVLKPYRAGQARRLAFLRAVRQRASAQGYAVIETPRNELVAMLLIKGNTRVAVTTGADELDEIASEEAFDAVWSSNAQGEVIELKANFYR